MLLNITADDPQSQARLAAFAQGLQQLGWTIGQNVLVDYRWGRGDAEAMRKHAAELVALDVILAQRRPRTIGAGHYVEPIEGAR